MSPRECRIDTLGQSTIRRITMTHDTKTQKLHRGYSWEALLKVVVEKRAQVTYQNGKAAFPTSDAIGVANMPPPRT